MSFCFHPLSPSGLSWMIIETLEAKLSRAVGRFSPLPWALLPRLFERSLASCRVYHYFYDVLEGFEPPTVGSTLSFASVRKRLFVGTTFSLADRYRQSEDEDKSPKRSSSSLRESLSPLHHNLCPPPPKAASLPSLPPLGLRLNKNSFCL